jgi:alpha-mannosidase
MDTYVFMRPGPHEYRLPSPVFWWESADGSRVLTYRLPHEYCAPREDLGYHLDKSIAQLPERWSEMMAFYGVGNHGGGPTRENLESIRRLDGAGNMPHLRHSTPRAFFDTIRASGVKIPVVRDDLQHHAVGCYSAHSGIKRWMRRAENELGTAEVWATIAEHTTGRQYPAADLSRAWKQVLFNQFHDTLGGTAIEPAYRDARDQLGEATSIAGRVQNVSIQSISQMIDLPEPGTVPIVVFNSHPWPVRAMVELEYGGLKPTDGLTDLVGEPVPFQQIQSYATVSSWRSRICFEAELPPLGYRTYLMRPEASRPPGSALRATDTVLENDSIRVELDPTTGRIRSLSLRDGGRDLVVLGDPGRSRARVVDDTSDTWGHRILAYREEIGAFEATNVELIERGPVRAILRVDSSFGDSRLIEDFVLTASGDSVELRVILDWRERSKLLKLRFPTGLREPTATYEIPYGVIERPANGEEEPGQRWIDVSGALDGPVPVGGLAVLNDGKYAFDIHQGEPGVTAVRSPIYAHHEPTVPKPGVRYQFQDQGTQRFVLRLVPHRGGWADAGLARRAMELNQRPTVLVESIHPGPLAREREYGRLEPENLVLGAMKMAEDGSGAIVRVVETAGRATSVRLTLPAWDAVVAFEIGGFEIRTFRISRGGAVEEMDLLERPLSTEVGPKRTAPRTGTDTGGRSRGPVGARTAG